MEDGLVFDSLQVQEILPHRHPFLMIDKVIEFVPNERITAIKNVSINEWFFTGHFPGLPIMPGALILEALAQAGAILALKSDEGVKPGTLIFIVGANEVKWKRKVVPGDTLRLEVVFVKYRKPLWIINGRALVDGKLAASATISAAESD